MNCLATILLQALTLETIRAKGFFISSVASIHPKSAENVLSRFSPPFGADIWSL